MRLSDFDYELPKERIALEPATPRDSSRLMGVSRTGGAFRHGTFRDIVTHLSKGDVLVLNDTRVIPARLIGRRDTGGRVEALLVERIEGNRWRAWLDTSRRLQVGEDLSFAEGLKARIVGRDPGRGWELEWNGDVTRVWERIGEPPLPPYIKRPAREEDRQRYQTVYAKEDGAIAAPTAGLHFTPELLAEIERRGVLVRRLTLHVGVGTFQPVKVEDVETHRMESERYMIPPETLEVLRGGRVVAVGTTTTRALETWARTGLAEGRSDLFIRPPYDFRVVNALVTNFHLPCSTLLMLVSAFAGRERILEAYREAIREGYRFYSYGDAMMLS